MDTMTYLCLVAGVILKICPSQYIRVTMEDMQVVMLLLVSHDNGSVYVHILVTMVAKEYIISYIGRHTYIRNIDNEIIISKLLIYGKGNHGNENVTHVLHIPSLGCT